MKMIEKGAAFEYFQEYENQIKPDYRFEYRGCVCTCNDETTVDWCVIHGTVVHSDLIWIDHMDMFMPVRSRVISRNEASLVFVPEGLHSLKCNCSQSTGKLMWVCPIHGPQAVCTCFDDWYMDHVCPAHGFVARSDQNDFKYLQNEDALRDFCNDKVKTMFGLEDEDDEEESPCDTCDLFPDGCRDNCPMAEFDD
jgi:hypothetical protein